MERYLFNLSECGEDPETVLVQPNIWMMSSEDIPPILFTPEEVARFLGVGRDKVYKLINHRALQSVKVGCSRRVSARALKEYVASLEVGEPA